MLIKALSIIGLLVLAGVGWYKYIRYQALREYNDKVIRETREEQQRLIENAGRVRDEMEGMDKTERRRHNRKWS